VDLALAVLVTLAGLVLFAYSGIGGNRRAGFLFLQNIELRTLDLRFALRGSRPHDDRVVIVGIDEKTLQKLGSFPLPRTSYAQLVQSLSGAGARVIAFDATFPTPESNSALAALQKLHAEIAPGVPPSFLKKIRDLEAASDQDAAFAAALKQSGNVVLGHLFLDEQRARLSDPKRAEEYFNVAWAKAFPQVLKVKSKDGSDFDLGKSWIESGGTVAAGPRPTSQNSWKQHRRTDSLISILIPTARFAALLIMRYQDRDFFPRSPCTGREYERFPTRRSLPTSPRPDWSASSSAAPAAAVARWHRAHQLHGTLPDLPAILNGGCN
jgi:adenylate cyclase